MLNVKRSRDEKVLPALWNKIATARDKVPLLPSLDYQLAAYRRHHCLRGLGPLLSSESFLIRAQSSEVSYGAHIIQGIKQLMSETDKTTRKGANHAAAESATWPGIDSRYRLIVVAALRSKQLLNGSLPRIEDNPLRHRNTSIALEEVKRGLVSFTIDDQAHEKNGVDKEQKSGE
jgi:DNA-directed RNA polymerase omega subunit